MRSKGNRAFKVRSVWNSEGKPFAYVITNKVPFSESKGDDRSKFLVNLSNFNSCTIVRSPSGSAHTDDTVEYVKKVAQWLDKNCGLQLKQLVCDFVKDS